MCCEFGSLIRLTWLKSELSNQGQNYLVRCLVPFKRRMNWIINHLFWWIAWPSDRFADLRVRSFDESLGVGSLRLTLSFGLGNWVVPSPQGNHGSQWVANDVEIKNGRTSVCGELYTLFFFSLFSCPSFLFFTMTPVAYVHRLRRTK